MHSKPTIRARAPRLTYDSIPRHWMGGSVITTQLANALHALFPSGERFLMRAVQPYVEEVRAEDPELFAQLRGFFAQEGHHGREHERFLLALVSQGHDVERFRRLFDRVAFQIIEPRAPQPLRLATAVAFEHLFATVADAALSRGVVETLAPRSVADLLLWHAAEEIEHKAVLFDVLALVDPRLRLRLAGMGCALAIYTAFVLGATAWFLTEDPAATPGRVLRDLARGPTLGAVPLRTFVTAVAAYVRRDFHPMAREDDLERARTLLASRKEVLAEA